MKKVFVDIYLQFNLGDDLFLDILVRKFPNSEFTINYLGRSYDNFISKYKNVRSRKYTLINKIGQRLKISDSITNYDKVAEEHDALLFIGGAIFREEDYHATLYKDRMHMVNEFKKREKSIFIIGANFGPFKSTSFFNDYWKMFKLCDDVCFRDQFSYQLFKELPQVRYAPDIVFQMNVDEYKAIDTKKRVGFSIIDVHHKQGLSNYHNDYINSTVKSIETLVKQGYECYLMSFCEIEGDLKVIKEIKNHLSPETLKRTNIYEYKGNLKEAITLIASFSLFIAARFHANILGLILDVGILPIIYSDKTLNMLKDIDFKTRIIEMENLKSQYDIFIIKQSINQKNNINFIKEKSIQQFTKLQDFCELNENNKLEIL